MSGAFRSAGVGVVGRSDVRRGSLRARYSPLGRAASMSLVSGRGGRVNFMQVPLGEFLPFGLMPRGERPNLSLLLLDQIGAGFLAGGHMWITAAVSRMLRVKRAAFSAMPLCELDDLVAMRQAQLGHPDCPQSRDGRPPDRHGAASDCYESRSHCGRARRRAVLAHRRWGFSARIFGSLATTGNAGGRRCCCATWRSWLVPLFRRRGLRSAHRQFLAEDPVHNPRPRALLLRCFAIK
jgi:hypothetical protein